MHLIQTKTLWDFPGYQGASFSALNHDGKFPCYGSNRRHQQDAGTIFLPHIHSTY